MGVEEDRGLPDPVTLAKMLRYEPETGRLFWLERDPSMFKHGRCGPEHVCKLWNAQNAGKEAFTAISHGYHVGALNHINMRAHRVIWTLVTGKWPTEQIDHINHNRGDNRWSNLRLATLSANSRNQSMMASNTSGVCGVAWHKGAGKWRAQIELNGKQQYLGLFIDKNDAIAARKAAEIRFNFHPNHGKAAAA